MAKYLVQACYGADGVRGLIQGGGSSRVAVVEAVAQQMGGTVESVYFSFGDADVICIMDMPDNVSAAAASLAVNASGSTTAKITPLITPEELDAAAKKVPSYTPPG
jgi:uncharacterized protein with GYD domain